MRKARNRKVSQDYLLKLGQEKKASRDFNAENLYHRVASGTKRTNILDLMQVNIWLLLFLGKYMREEVIEYPRYPMKFNNALRLAASRF